MSSNKRKRVVLTVDKKCEIIKRRKEGESISSLALTFGIGESTVRDIIKNELKIEHFISKCETYEAVSQRKSMKGAMHEQLDSVMMEWILQQRAQGASITGPSILNKAKYFFEKLEIPGTFQFSSGWLKRFKERHGIRDNERVSNKKEVKASKEEKTKSSQKKNENDWLNFQVSRVEEVVTQGKKETEKKTSNEEQSWINIHNNVINYEEISSNETINNKTDLVEVKLEEEEESMSTSTSVSSEEALKAANVLLSFMQSQNVDCVDVLQIRAIIRKIKNIMENNK